MVSSIPLTDRPIPATLHVTGQRGSRGAGARHPHGVRRTEQHLDVVVPTRNDVLHVTTSP
jgi:hypothetical protein